MSDEPTFRHVIFGEDADDHDVADTGVPIPDPESAEEDEDLYDYDDDLDLPPPKPRRRMTLTTALLFGAVVLTAGFLVGVLVQRHYGGTASASTGNGAAAAGRRLGAQLTGRGATIGQVTTVDGNTLYVTTVQGDTVKVTTSAATTVTKPTTVSIDSVNPGDTVVVQGTQQADGSSQATQVSISGSGGQGGFGGGGFGAGSGG